MNRWWFWLIILGLCGVAFFHLRNKMIEHQTLSSIAKNLEEKSSVVFKNQKSLTSRVKTFDYFLLLVEMNHMKLKSVERVGANQYTLQLKANFANFHQLLTTLRKNNVPIKVNKITMRLNPNRLLLTTVTIEVAEHFMQSISIQLLKAKVINPFCQYPPFHLLKEFSIYQVLFIGVMQDEAILKLPNGQNISVKKGTEIGMEKAKLLKVSHNQIKFILANKKYVTLSLVHE